MSIIIVNSVEGRQIDVGRSGIKVGIAYAAGSHGPLHHNHMA